MADAAVHPALQEQFDDLEQQREVASLGMWVFLVTEVLFFSGLFIGYAIYRAWYPEAFAAGSHHMDIVLGTVNTAVLITSSLTVVLTVRAGQLGARNGQVLFLALTILLGLVFLGIKAVEYYDHFQHNLVPGAGFEWTDGGENVVPQVQLFFTLYFVMTGLHALHMVVGIGIMAVLLLMAWRGRYGPDYHNPLEVGGLYWHFVDIVWIFLFPLLYLIDLHAR